jgi:hypothetical protein
MRRHGCHTNARRRRREVVSSSALLRVQDPPCSQSSGCTSSRGPCGRRWSFSGGSGAVRPGGGSSSAPGLTEDIGAELLAPHLPAGSHLHGYRPTGRAFTPAGYSLLRNAKLGCESGNATGCIDGVLQSYVSFSYHDSEVKHYLPSWSRIALRHHLNGESCQCLTPPN